jgi:hypothetical protein
MFSLKKLAIFCLFIFLISCKDKEVVEQDPDYATEFVGNYYTDTAFDTYGTHEDWTVERIDKNLLGITYKEVINITKPIKQTVTYIYTLRNVLVTNATTIVINENADFDKAGSKIRAKVEGTGLKLQADGISKIGITLKITDLSNNDVTTREYLEFKKK